MPLFDETAVLASELSEEAMSEDEPSSELITSEVAELSEAEASDSLPFTSPQAPKVQIVQTVRRIDRTRFIFLNISSFKSDS